VEPEEFNERIVLSDGSVSLVSYQGIEYVRTIGTAPTQTNEFLLAAYNEIDQGGGQNGAPNINLFVGIAVDPAALRVLKPST
jgi:hypothetical protein